MFKALVLSKRGLISMGAWLAVGRLQISAVFKHVLRHYLTSGYVSGRGKGYI